MTKHSIDTLEEISAQLIDLERIFKLMVNGAYDRLDAIDQK